MHEVRVLDRVHVVHVVYTSTQNKPAQYGNVYMTITLLKQWVWLCTYQLAVFVLLDKARGDRAGKHVATKRFVNCRSEQAAQLFTFYSYSNKIL